MERKLLEAYAFHHLGPGGTPAQAEGEIAAVALRVARNVASKYVFGYHGVEDIEQQGVLVALEAVAKGDYDVTRPLENFLYRHVKNRLGNYKRDHYMRLEAPCRCCDMFAPPPEPCRRWREWHTRNSAKQSLMRPVGVDAEKFLDRGCGDPAVLAETERSIDRDLPVALRADFLRLKAGERLSPARVGAVRAAVREILGTSCGGE